MFSIFPVLTVARAACGTARLRCPAAATPAAVAVGVDKLLLLASRGLYPTGWGEFLLLLPIPSCRLPRLRARRGPQVASPLVVSAIPVAAAAGLGAQEWLQQR